MRQSNELYRPELLLDLEGLEARLSRVADDALRAQFQWAAVPCELGYLPEVRSLLRAVADHGLTRLVEQAAGLVAAAAHAQVHEQLSRVKAAKVIEWLHREAETVPAGAAPRLRTLLALGSHASHHQRKEHRAFEGDVSRTVDLS